METQTGNRTKKNVEVFFSTLDRQAPGTCLWNEWEDAPYGEGWFFWQRTKVAAVTPPYGPYPSAESAKEIAVEMFGDEIE